jgi:hypothetical protein
MKKSALIPVIAEFHTATAAAVKVRLLMKPGIYNSAPVWIGRSRLRSYRDLPTVEGVRYVEFECPAWIIQQHGIIAGQLKTKYDKGQINKIKTFVTNVKEIVHRRIPTLERQGGKIDPMLRKIIQQSERYLDDEAEMSYPTTSFKDVDVQYRRAISAYRKLTSKAQPVKAPEKKPIPA